MIVVVRTRQCLPMNTHKTRENNLQQPPENRSKYICKHGVNQCCETQLEGLAAMFIQKKQNCTKKTKLYSLDSLLAVLFIPNTVSRV